MTLKGIIFDFDGLILDTETPRFRAWQEVFSSLGHEFSLKNYSKTIGSNNFAYDPISELSKIISDTNQIKDLITFQQNRELDLLKNQSTLPGVSELIETAKNKQLLLAIASSSDRKWVHDNLARLQMIDCFQYIWTEDDVSKVKPYPDLYEKAVHSLGLTPQEVVAFEDSPNGIRAAQAAHIFTICIPNSITKLLDISFADLIVDSMDGVNLTEIIAKFDLRSHNNGK